MKKIICCAVFYGVFINGLAFDGNTYVDFCKDYLATVKTPDDMRKAMRATSCMSYTRGAVEMAGLFHQRLNGIKDTFGGSAIVFCIPDGVTQDQLIRVALKWMEDNPAMLHITASFHLMSAFKEAFPCTDE